MSVKSGQDVKFDQLLRYLIVVFSGFPRILQAAVEGREARREGMAASSYLTESETVRRAQLSQLPPPKVTQALVHAASVLTIRDDANVRCVDMRPLIIHLLSGLEQVGVRHVVLTLGQEAAQVAECVTAYKFTLLRIDFVYLTLGSAVGVCCCRSRRGRRCPSRLEVGSQVTA